MEAYPPFGYINMKPWYEDVLKILILIPLKLIELTLNCFAFVIFVIVSAIIKIVNAFKK